MPFLPAIAVSGFLATLFYVPALAWPLGTWIFKPLTTALLMAYAATARGSASPVYRRRITTGLFFSLLGDIALLAREQHRAFFLAGMAFFLFAHVAYISAFWRKSPGLGTRAILPLAVVAVYTGGLFFGWLRPGLGTFFWPVAVYTLAITGMGWRAGMTGDRPLILGAAFFIASDTLIALHKFHAPLEYERLLVIPVYYAGQFLIARSARS